MRLSTPPLYSSLLLASGTPTESIHEGGQMDVMASSGQGKTSLGCHAIPCASWRASRPWSRFLIYRRPLFMEGREL
jgi:hypothetical protein